MIRNYKNPVNHRTKRLWAKFKKLRIRLNRQLEQGNFQNFSKNRQRSLLRRLSRYQAQLKTLGYAAVLSIPLLLTPTLAEAQDPIGLEFQVNTNIISSQGSPSMAMDNNGDFVVVWESENQDGDGLGIYGQQYSSGGVPTGLEFPINTHTTSHQENPSIAMDSDGNFVVVWESNAQDGDGNGIYGQRFDATGVPQDIEFQVNTHTTSSQQNPSVAMDSDGYFIVTWESNDQDGDDNGIYGQRFRNNGLLIGSEFPINTHTTSNQENASVAIDSDGDFVVTWQSDGQDGDSDGIYGRRYDNNGIDQGAEFLINTYTTNDQNSPVVAMDSGGDFVVAWQSDGQDGSGYGIYGKRFDSSGAEDGLEFRVNTDTISNQTSPAVAMDSDGDFVVTWESFYSVQGQQYNNNGPEGAQFIINTFTSGYQNQPAVAMDSDGSFMVTWQSDGQDGNGYGIYGQGYGPILPVELIDFSVRLNNDEESYLEWQTASEINNKGFEVQRRGDDSEWEKLGFVEGNGNSVKVESYSFVDNNPQKGINYYRLRQLDYDGTEDYSDIVTVTVDKADEAMQVFPNPTQDGKFTILLSEENTEETTMELYDVLGRLVHQTTVYSGNELQVNGLAKGMYLLVVKKGDRQWQERVLNQ